MPFNRDRFLRLLAMNSAIGMVLAAMLAGLYVFTAWLTGTSDEATARVFLGIVLRMLVPVGAVAAVMAFLHEAGPRMSHSFYAGREGMGGPPLDLSRIRAMIIREEFDQARAELDREWGLYPGEGALLREYDHMFAAMHAPSGAVAFLTGNLFALSGEDRAYALLRLAEISADSLRHPLEARKWCQKLLDDFPDSPHAAQARAMLGKPPTDSPPRG